MKFIKNLFKINPSIEIQSNGSASSIEFTNEFKRAIEIINNQNFTVLFITGKAGTGKTTLLKYLKENLLKYNSVFLAPTGVAAVNISGQTIHSFFKFPPRFIVKSDIKKSKLSLLYKAINYVIIDECSMIKADLFDAIDYSLKINRDDPTPFGGVKIIIFGDLYQLPPIVNQNEEILYQRHNYKTPYFFSSRIFKQTLSDAKIIELTHVFRQNDEEYLDILEEIRYSRSNDNLFEKINSRLILDQTNLPSNTTILTTTNNLARKHNEQFLNKINSEIMQYKGVLTGNFSENEIPGEKYLKLKKGAKVIFLRNDPAKRWINGSIGIVHKLYYEYVEVFVNNTVVEVHKEKWEKIQYVFENGTLNNFTTGTFVQLPLRLGWAITIHKSQGLTLDNILVDTSISAFASGQIYVALSRCRNFNNLFLSNPLTSTDIILNSEIELFIDYMKTKNNYA